MHEPERRAEHHDEDDAAEHEGHAEVGRLGDDAAGDRAGEHRDAAHDLAAREHRLQSRP